MHQIAKRLMQDEVDVVFDRWDLKEGQDKNAFMEKMVTDPTVTHVLVICDAAYVSKADNRKAGGVGTESQIISQEVYAKVNQTKFIPIFFELDELGAPLLPVFLKSRIGIDFSTPAKLGDNWPQLIHLLYGKPLYEKPPLGKRPSYLDGASNGATPPTRGKLATLQQVLLNGRPGVPIYRKSFVDSACECVSSLRPKTEPPGPQKAEDVVSAFRKLLPVRDDLAAWVLVEAQSNRDSEFTEALQDALEQLLRVKFRTHETESWQDHWSDPEALFVYNVFLHVVAALIRSSRFDVLNALFKYDYWLPITVRHLGHDHLPFTVFRGHSDVVASSGPNSNVDASSPIAKLFKDTVTALEFSFENLMEAELLVFMAALVLRPGGWFPATITMVQHSTRFPLFLKAANPLGFRRLAEVTGVRDAEALRREVRTGLEQRGVRQWGPFVMRGIDFWSLMNMGKLRSS